MSSSRTTVTPPVDEYAAARTYLEHLFDTSNSQTSCLSVLPHDLKNVHDLQCHFFGCLDIKNRVKVLDDADHPIWEQAKRLENEDTELHPRVPCARSPDPSQRDDDDEQLDMRYITALNLQAELKRIAVLRRTPALKGLVREVRTSIETWREDNLENIKKIRERRENSHTWNKQKSPPPLTTTTRSTGISLGPRRTRTESPSTSQLRNRHRRRTLNEDEASRKELEEDLEKFERKLKDIIEEKRSKDSEPEPDEDDPAVYDLKRDIKARLIKLERPEVSGSDAGSFVSTVMEPLEENVDDKIFKGSFPDQQVSVYHLLKSKFKRRDKRAASEEKVHEVEYWKDGTFDHSEYEAALSGMLDAETACPSELRYYHIPVNNMSWVEQAIATYFDESTTKPGGGFELGPQTKLVLQDGCWRGQEHNGGPGSVVHTRNLRPICEKISTDVEDLYHSGESTQKGLVLFMPFLHWETDRRRNQAANFIEQLTDEHELEKRETTKMWKSKRKDDRAGLDTASSPDSATPDYREPNYYRPRGRDRDEILRGLAKMLWEKIGDGHKNVPSGLSHALWQRIRTEAYGDTLLLVLEEIVYTRPTPPALSSMLRSPAMRSIFYDESQRPEHRLREWKDILWEIKAAGRGYPTPHALEDILWNEIKRERKRADTESSPKTRNHGQKQHPHEKIFQKETTIFKGIDVDEYGRLQPVNPLAKILVRAAQLYEEMMTYPDQRIMEEYLFNHPPLHPRRTLDQAYFWRLRNTRLRDRDQVVYRYTNAEHAHRFLPQPPSRDVKNDRSRFSVASGSMTKRSWKDKAKQEHWVWTRHGEYEVTNGCEQCDEDIRKVSRAIMVDQLWIWVLDKDTILTCFPQRYGMSKDPSGVHQSIRTRVKTRSNPDNYVLSIFDLALIILDESFDTFFSRTRTPDKRPQVMDMFAESIGRVTNKQAIAFKHLWQLSKRLTDIYQSGVEDKVDPALLLALLNVTPEAELQREIRDIVDELDIILHIAKQQKDMISRFVKFANQIIEADVDKYKPENGLSSSQVATLKLLRQQQSAFKTHSDDLSSEIEDRIQELTGMKESALSTAGNVNDLLSLKQQQASVVQAYEAMKQGEETVRQGKAIMVFTVMTIIFLPLSFMSSLFGMNAVELTGNDPRPGAGSSSSSNSSAGSSGAVPDEIVPFYPITFQEQVMVMFTVSFGAVLLVIVPAFSPFIRAFYSSIYHQSITKFITWTGLYKIWLKSGLKSKNVRDHGRANVRKMKKKVCDALARQTLQDSEIWDGVRDPTTKSPKEYVQRGVGARSMTGVHGQVTNGVSPQEASLRRLQDLEKGTVP